MLVLYIADLKKVSFLNLCLPADTWFLLKP